MNKKPKSLYLVHVGADKFHGLVEGVGVAGTRVQYDGADGDVGQDVGVVVDQVQGVEHGFQPLDALLLFDGSAREFDAAAADPVARHQVLVHGEQAAEDDVARNADQLVIVLLLLMREHFRVRRRILERQRQGPGRCQDQGGRRQPQHHNKRYKTAITQFLHGSTLCPVIRIGPSHTRRSAGTTKKPKNQKTKNKKSFLFAFLSTRSLCSSTSNAFNIQWLGRETELSGPVQHTAAGVMQYNI